jgi:hypothetical protein
MITSEGDVVQISLLGGIASVAGTDLAQRRAKPGAPGLKDEVAERLSLHRFPFKWMVMFTRAGKQVLTTDES